MEPESSPVDQAAVRDWDWFLHQVQEARDDRQVNLMHPGMAVKGLPALVRHQKRWQTMVGGAGADRGMYGIVTGGHGG